MGICQEIFIHLRSLTAKITAITLLTAPLSGCVLHRAAPPAAWPQHPPPPDEPHALGLYLILGVLLILFGWVGMRARRARLRRAGLTALDREEAALLRTARDALGFLVRRRLARLRPVPRPGPLSPRR